MPKRFKVAIRPRAQDDLTDIEHWIGAHGGPKTAERFVDRLLDYCDDLTLFPLRATSRDDLRPGLRIVTFEKSVSVAYAVGDDTVIILRFVYRGRELTAIFGDE